MAAEPVMRRLLEVLDDFELALMHAGEDVDSDRLLRGWSWSTRSSSMP